ncbi:MAG: hypothetical protein RBR88_03110 [Candidatus Saccharicenans sp.]|nr:hypothetical protein [Candidatus Saccharicenans sp.]
MGVKEKSYLVPALIGGALAGLASAIPFLHLFCCVWGLAGGVLATYFLADSASKQSLPFKISDGLLVGALAGVFGAIINVIVQIPLADYYLEWTRRFLESLSRFMEEVPAGWESLSEIGSQTWDPFYFLLNLLLSCLIFAFLGALGGLIGYSIFKPTPGAKNETQTPQNKGNSQSSL